MKRQSPRQRNRAALRAFHHRRGLSHTAAERSDDVAIRTKTMPSPSTWGELRKRVDSLGGGLAKLGLKRGTASR